MRRKNCAPVTLNLQLACVTMRLVLVAVAVVLWTSAAFSQNGKTPTDTGGTASQASPQANCPPKPTVGGAQAAVQAEPSTKVKPDNLDLKVAGASRESDAAQEELVHEKPLSTTVKFLTKDSKKPAQCEAKTTAGNRSE